MSTTEVGGSYEVILGRLRKPRVGTACVVHHIVNDDPDPARMGLIQQFQEILHRPEVIIDRLVIVHIVAMVARTRMDRHQPQGRDSQIVRGRWIPIVQIIQRLRNPLEIAHSIAITVLAAPDKDFVKDRIFPPIRQLSECKRSRKQKGEEKEGVARFHPLMYKIQHQRQVSHWEKYHE